MVAGDLRGRRVPTKKKLIEVALPLEAINKASAREKSIRHGHPSTLHLWWARRPLAAARAVIFAQMVDDPPAHFDDFPTEMLQDAAQKPLPRIIEHLVQWENPVNYGVLHCTCDEICQSSRYDLCSFTTSICSQLEPARSRASRPGASCF
jgi:putative DNA methylase